MTKHTKTLDTRIAAALNPDNEILASSEVAQLLADVEAAASEADALASKAHREAVDPTKILDTKTVATAVATAALHRDRLQAALGPLRERLKQAQEAEYAASWSAARDEVEKQRDNHVQKLRERIPVLFAELIDLVSEITKIDALVFQINDGRPAGEHSLQQTEELARGVERFGLAGYNGLLSLQTDLKLPKFTTDGPGAQLAWPPPKPAPQIGFQVPHNPLYSADWWQYTDERDRQRRAEFDRAVEQSVNAEAERERRREDEAKEWNEKQRREQGL
jgi:hypothetical protein